MDKSYDHTKYEKDIYQKWEDSGAFTPSPLSQTDKLTPKKAFTIIMPPPNANDPLHIGHARFVTIQDILIRYYRMKGYSALWLPGSDHAGIETQFVFEKKLKEKGQSRFDFDRETLYTMIWNYVHENTDIMHNQLRQLGASCDWTRHKFTLDPDIINVVYQTFKKLSDDGYVYRGKRIVNYCPRCGTNFSELEVDYAEQEDEIYYLDYGTVTIATTRPETIFADVAIAVNPKDKKKEPLIGKTAKIPLINREIAIIGDSAVELDFGTGALKVTPGHDATDSAIGERHNLPVMAVIDESGRMINTPEKYIGMKVAEARATVVQDLEEAGALVKREKLVHSVGHCYRCKGIIEPMVSEQWFIRIRELADNALKAIQKRDVYFPSKKYEKFAKHWLKNLRDWNVSRQIVWGIQIPAYRCSKCLEWTITDGEPPNECRKCKGTSFTRDQDTFDTWFSSAQWPFATLMTTKPGDFEYFYPTTVMNSSWDIVPFWIIRMIFFGQYATSQVPFRDVLIHGLVRDKQGVKISKSKGNVINPIEMVDKYGADALRMGLTWGSNVDNDISLSEDNIRGQRNFSNKLWNVSRYIFMNSATDSNPKVVQHHLKKSTHEEDKKILKEAKQLAKQVGKLVEKYRLNEAALLLYDFVWKNFANDYLEKTKARREEAQSTLEEVLVIILKVAHPFMPFVTEAIWGTVKDKSQYFDSNLLMSANWPK